ncbi:heterokaryon incompatibility protein-domain-containing protein [Earliella scabrosa]|nr:heterokaryon incompatibility protein-domain-containing protein [Earliella scabrosa]
MWVIETPTLLLHEFTSPERVPGGYAILSHVWEPEDKEWTFQKVNQLRDRSLEKRRELVSLKIRNFCDLAESEGYKWGWIDTCCIDKTSSAELSEAINSMFQYYSLAYVCYAYLQDVPLRMGGPFEGNFPHFYGSQWHKRGWTLQELIAPRVVLFLSNSWEFIGTKTELADRLEHITGIPASILRLESKLQDFCIAQRMSWAARRKTTRLEDEAYCLLGIFDINMPTLYGEGRKAFRRLQEEIMKQSSDTTLFAWGRSSTVTRETAAPAPLFATGPSDFRHSHHIYHAPRVLERRLTQTDKSGGEYLISFNITPHGIQAHIPIVRIDGQPFADLGWMYRLDSKPDCPLLLCLNDYHEPHFNSTRPRYTVASFDLHSKYRGIRIVAAASLDVHSFWQLIDKCLDPECEHIPSSELSPVHLDQNLGRLGKPVTLHAMWKDVYLHDVLSSAPNPTENIYIPINHTYRPLIRIAEHLIANVKAQMYPHHTSHTSLKVVNGSLPWTGDSPMSIELLNWSIFRYSEFGRRRRCGYGHIRLVLGRCTEVNPGSLWANIRREEWHAPEDEIIKGLEKSQPGHQCPGDHILSWPGLKRSFDVKTDGHSATLTLDFALCNGTTLTLRGLEATERSIRHWLKALV